MGDAGLRGAYTLREQPDMLCAQGDPTRSPHREIGKVITMNTDDALSWQESLARTFEALMDRWVVFAPQLLGVLVLLIVGFVIAYLLRVLTARLVRGLDSIFQRVAKSDSARRERIKGSFAEIISRIVFWTVLIFFSAVAANMLGWQLFSGWMDSLIAYLPRMITGVLIILAGFLFGGAARAGVAGAAHSAGVEQAEMLARLAQVVILFTTFVVGIEQIGIQVHFLSDALIVVSGVLLAGGALAFGLGAKNLVANVIGAQYVRKHCRIGEHLHMGNVEGNVVDVTGTTIVIETESGRTLIPAKLFQEQISSFSAGEISTKDEGSGPRAEPGAES